MLFRTLLLHFPPRLLPRTKFITPRCRSSRRVGYFRVSEMMSPLQLVYKGGDSIRGPSVFLSLSPFQMRHAEGQRQTSLVTVF